MEARNLLCVKNVYDCFTFMGCSLHVHKVHFNLGTVFNMHAVYHSGNEIGKYGTCGNEKHFKIYMRYRNFFKLECFL